MIEFARITPFQLVRRLAASGQEGSSIYMAIAEPPAIDAVEADLAAEIEVQLGIDAVPSRLRIPLDRFDEALRGSRLARAAGDFRPWLPKLVESRPQRRVAE